MTVFIMGMIDKIDPYPLVLRRPQPKSQADIWFEQEFSELLAKKKDIIAEKVKKVFSESKEEMAERITKNNELVKRMLHPDQRNGWSSGTPTFPGFYLTRSEWRGNPIKAVRREFKDGMWMHLTEDRPLKYADHVQYQLGSRTDTM